MEGGVQTYPQLGYSIDNDDAKYFSGLSTILVATIQEAKDRISQIEYIFCSQIFPNFQSRSKSLHKRYAEAMKTAEDEWRRKESCLLLQIEELRLEKQKALEQNQHLVLSLEQEKEKLVNNEARKAAEDEWRNKESCLLSQIEKLRLEAQQALEENRYLVISLEQEKAKLMNNEQMLNEHGTEKKLLLAKVENLEKNGEVAELQGQLKRKTEEVAEGKKLQEELREQIELSNFETMIEKKKRMDVVYSFKSLKAQYNVLKSQNNFLRNKFGLTMENMLPGNRMEEESHLSRLHQNPRIANGPKSKDLETSGVVSKTNEQKDENSLQDKLDNNKGDILIENSSSKSNIKSPSTIGSSCPVKSPSSEPLAGTKRSVSCWRDTRSRQEPGKTDPHDDFLDTPIENFKGNLNKVLKEEVHDFAVPAPKDMEFDSSDDETQDINGEPALHKHHISITRPDDRGFKYVEPVRKKADRENLKGFECKQCKKFYDAVLPDGGKNNNDNSNFRCEHHDGVSRHRYSTICHSHHCKCERCWKCRHFTSTKTWRCTCQHCGTSVTIT